MVTNRHSLRTAVSHSFVSYARASQCTAARVVYFQRLFIIVRLFWGGASRIVSNSAVPLDSTNNYALYCETTCTSVVYVSALRSTRRLNWHIVARSYVDRQEYSNAYWLTIENANTYLHVMCAQSQGGTVQIE